eukprot:TRINITY_DN5000_c0_g1_i5.p1 TRINITY_DN5000_c0_g1~~TRINITY_DN5000_c0_g1_i5.p1  ORF type:complete len:206 (-),score=44.34 TRINITY_DN5000_c0_g1_i5:109-726(-)
MKRTKIKKKMQLNQIKKKFFFFFKIFFYFFFFFFQAEDGIRDHAQSRGLGDVYKRQVSTQSTWDANGNMMVLIKKIAQFVDAHYKKFVQNASQETQISVLFQLVFAIILFTHIAFQDILKLIVNVHQIMQIGNNNQLQTDNKIQSDFFFPLPLSLLSNKLNKYKYLLYTHIYFFFLQVSFINFFFFLYMNLIEQTNFFIRKQVLQ